MIRDTGAKLVHSHDIPSHLVSAFAQAPVSKVASVHGIVDRTLRQRVWNMASRPLLRRAHHVIFGSPQIQEQFPFVGSAKSSLIWNAIERRLAERAN